MEYPKSKGFLIKEILWDRVFLNFKIESQIGGAKFTLDRIEYSDKVKENYKVIEQIEIPYNMYDGKIYDFTLNVCQLEGNTFLENGLWIITAHGSDENHKVYVAEEVAEDYDSLSRVFRYGELKSYNITFNFNLEDEVFLQFMIESYFVVVDNKWKQRVGKKAAVERIGVLFYNIYRKLFKKNKRNILFLSQTSTEISGNLEKLDTRFKERGLTRKYHISYYFNNDVGDKKNYLKMLKLAFKIPKQDVIFVDNFVPIFSLIDPAEKTKLVQVWHAGIGFKAVGYCRFGKSGSPHPYMSCHRKYTHAIAPGEKGVDVFSEVFGIGREKFVVSGMPRLDGFLDMEKEVEFKGDFYTEYPQFTSKKIILFAPTYRGKNQENAYYDYSKIDLDRIYECCGDKYVFMIKMHPFIQENIHIPEKYKDVIVDFSDYKNINDLYYITDVLITDYSSNYYEYALLEKPIIFYTYDRKIYEISRGVHRSVKNAAPGKVCDTFDQLIQAIQDEDWELEKTIAFKAEYFKDYGSNGADKLIDELLPEEDRIDE